MTSIIEAYEEGKAFGQRMGAAGVWGEVNKFLKDECGLEYPEGMKGLRDLKQQRDGHLAALQDYKEMMAERIHDEMNNLHEWMKHHSGAGPMYTRAKLNEIEHFLKEGR